MALTVKQLKGMGLTEAQVEAIIDGHMETVEGLKEKIGTLEADLKEVPGLKAQLEAARQGGSEDWKGMHDKVKKAFDDYKAEVAGKEQAEKVRAAYRGLLEEAHIDPRRIDVVLRATRLDDMKLDDEGKLEGVDQLRAAIRRDWGDFVQTKGERGADVKTPPERREGGRMTRGEIMGIKDAGERWRAIAENHEMFGF